MSRVQKDNPKTWKSYSQSLCQSCQATCCTMPAEIRGEDLVRLGFLSTDEISSSIKKATQKLIKQKIIKSYREKTGLFMLAQKANGECVFLDSQTRLCTVYELRPQMCRDFPSKIGLNKDHCPYLKK